MVVAVDVVDPAVVPDDVRLARLFDDPVRVLLPSHHPLAGRRSVTLEDLTGETWIRPHDGSAARLVDHVLATRAARPALVLAGRGDEPVETQALVAAGRGVTLSYDLTVLVSDHQLAVVPIEDLQVHRTVYAAIADGHHPAAVTTVLDVLLEIGHRRRPA